MSKTYADLAAYHLRRASHFAALGDEAKASKQLELAAIYNRRALEG